MKPAQHKQSPASVLQLIRRRRFFTIVLLLSFLGVLGASFVLLRQKSGQDSDRAEMPMSEEAPPDLQKLRGLYADGLAALQRNDGAEAVRILSSFTFGPRAVEEYRLYYLANGHQLAGNTNAARTTLARLWRRSPRFIYSEDAAFHLTGLYTSAGDQGRTAEVAAALARRSDNPAVAANARWLTAMTRLERGDVAGALYSARSIVIHNPRSAQAEEAVALVRALTVVARDKPLPLTPSERLERAEALLTGGDARSAIVELEALEAEVPSQLNAVRLQRGMALHRLRRYEDSNKILEPLTSGPFKYSIPALRHAARNYAALAAAIDPDVYKTIKERKRAGSVKVRVGKGKNRRTVTRPKYQTVFRKVKKVDLAKKARKEELDRLASERLKDLLSLELSEALRLETLNALIVRAESRNQDEYLQELVPLVIKLDPDADPALQHFWDKGWGAYTRGDLDTARETFGFIAATYTHVNVRRQSDYWYARVIERQGRKREAAEIYQKLASAPYADLYALHAAARGARRQEIKVNPLAESSLDWGVIAEKSMPRELRLAHELASLASMREAYLEIRRNSNPKNVRYAEALLADVHRSSGNEVLMYRSLRRAWPALGTVEQDTVPPYFISMYYPRRYSEFIEQSAKKYNLDPHLVRALILQESYYNPEAKSRVGATGLMQLMPPTANEHGRRLRIAFAASRLEDPEVNVQLGTYHLRMLTNLFNGNTFLAIAAYNAGQGNVMKWRRAAPKRPMDEFLESIPFPETRNYVKRLTMLRSAYARLTL